MRTAPTRVTVTRLTAAAVLLAVTALPAAAHCTYNEPGSQKTVQAPPAPPAPAPAPGTRKDG